MDTKISPTSALVRLKKAIWQLQPHHATRAGLPRKLFRWAVRGIFKLVFRVEVHGLQNVPTTPVIVCANHLGWADAFLVMLFLPARLRIYVLGEKQVRTISGTRTRIIDALQVMVWLDRDKPVQALRAMREVVGRGGSLLIFPEGNLGSMEGEIGELQHGAAHLSQLTGVPVLPVGLTGTSRLWLRRTLTIRIGRAIEPLARKSDMRISPQSLTSSLGASMRNLLPGDHERAQVRLLSDWLTSLF